MTSILKVNNIQNSSGNAAVTIDGSGNATFPQNVTFSGTTAGAGSMIKLFSGTIGNVANYDTINSTYINTSYDIYKIYYCIRPVTDNVGIQIRFFVGGSVVDASNTYSYETSSINGTGQVNEGADKILINYDGTGNGAGEGSSGFIELQNVNNTLFPTSLTGIATNYKNSTHSLHYFSGAFKRANYASAVNGLRFYTSSGNISEGKIQVYGIQE
jgi:hypothetical protein